MTGAPNQNEQARVAIDTTPRCLNGWGPGCYPYCGGHYCERKPDHPGRCRCQCGATTTGTRYKP